MIKWLTPFAPSYTFCSTTLNECLFTNKIEKQMSIDDSIPTRNKKRKKRKRNSTILHLYYERIHRTVLWWLHEDLIHRNHLMENKETTHLICVRSSTKWNRETMYFHFPLCNPQIVFGGKWIIEKWTILIIYS